ncbi:MAG: BrnT family toxin [Proteobacteria bacterium]|nr:BrnT family toxin [Pseudomonadota bacterium]
MDIEFDPNKDEVNRRKYGLSLAEAARLDFDTAAVLADDRRVYGEARFRAYGLIDRRLHMLAFTMRGDVLRVISLRRANRTEVRRYDAKA